MNDVPKMLSGCHEEKNPIQELSEMTGGKQVIVALVDQAMGDK